MKIIEGDVLDKLKELDKEFVDLSITSPPYNKKEKENSGLLVRAVKYENFRDVLPEKDYQKSQIDVINAVFDVTKKGGSFFYNHKIRWDKGNMIHPMDWLRKTKWIVKQEIVWNRKIAGQIRGWRFWQIDERIYWLYKPIKKNKIGKELDSKHAHLSSVWEISVETKNVHPAPFPIDLPTRIIYSIMNEDSGIVLDPYTGSGTTLLAAKLLNKDYIGIDISKKYIDMSENRIKNPSNYDLKRFAKEMSYHIVSKTYKERKEEKKKKANYLLDRFGVE